MAFPFKINGNELSGGAYPSVAFQGASFSIESMDGSGAGRNQNGDMIRDFIGEKIKWQLTFVPCTPAQLANLLALVDGESFQFTYPNPVTGATETRKFYCGARSSPVCLCDKQGNITWGNLTFNVIEF